MKTFACAALAAISVADQADFPRDDAFHADCHVNAVFQASCDQVYSKMDTNIRSYDTDTTSPSQGVYTLKEESQNDYIWSTRLTKNKQYTDDQLFNFTQSDSNVCTVVGHSRSQSMSVYDYSVNFCNLWNVYNGLGIKFTYSIPKKQCAYPADDPASTCAVY